MLLVTRLPTHSHLSTITLNTGSAGILNPHFIDKKPRVREAE